MVVEVVMYWRKSIGKGDDVAVRVIRPCHWFRLRWWKGSGSGLLKVMASLGDGNY